jgi:hypothetical protein
MSSVSWRQSYFFFFCRFFYFNAIGIFSFVFAGMSAAVGGTDSALRIAAGPNGG